MTVPLIGITTWRTEAGGDSYACLATYTLAVAAAGGAPVLLPYGFEERLLRPLFDSLAGLLLAGGGDIDPQTYGSRPTAQLRGLDQARDHQEMLLARWAAQEAKPFLGICRGLQVINVALGGTLYQDIHAECPDTLDHDQPGTPPDRIAHPVLIEPGARLGALIGSTRLDANSSHHQAIKDLASVVRLAALAPDGVIEAIELTGHPFGLAVQWHPERLIDRPEMLALFRGLTLAACR
jgi:putative glutamine amidotransferase